MRKYQQKKKSSAQEYKIGACDLKSPFIRLFICFCALRKWLLAMRMARISIYINIAYIYLSLAGTVVCRARIHAIRVCVIIFACVWRKERIAPARYLENPLFLAGELLRRARGGVVYVCIYAGSFGRRFHHRVAARFSCSHTRLSHQWWKPVGAVLLVALCSALFRFCIYNNNNNIN